MWFIFSSSCTVYGQADRMPITETLPIKKSEFLMVKQNKFVKIF